MAKILREENIVVMIPTPIRDEYIPRKFVRSLNGQPLISYTIEISKHITPDSQVFVLTDDEEISLIACRRGVNTHLYLKEPVPGYFGEGNTFPLLESFEKERNQKVDYLVWLSPSSPLLSAKNISDAISVLANSSRDAIFSASEVAQRVWKYTHTYQPNFGVSTSDMGGVLHQERGSFFIMKGNSISTEGYVGKKAAPFLLPEKNSLEIVTFQDFWVAEKFLSRKRLLFVVVGSDQNGMGHVYRSLMLAQEFHAHEVRFVCTMESNIATKHIIENQFQVTQQHRDQDLIDAVEHFSPDIVINDILDTSAEYVKALKSRGVKVVNFEDQGEGAVYADKVINALYEESYYPNFLTGPDYFCLRTEFYAASPSMLSNGVKNILVTFGGTDHKNLSLRLLKIIIPLIKNDPIHICLLTGAGYEHADELESWLSQHPLNDKVKWVRNGTRQISEYMSNADFAVTSGGRTVYELTAMQVPAIVIPVNEREKRHQFARKAGMILMDGEDTVLNESIIDRIIELKEDPVVRARIKLKLAKFDLTRGKERVLSEIEKCL